MEITINFKCPKCGYKFKAEDLEIKKDEED